jgi:hypothetical protein
VNARHLFALTAIGVLAPGDAHAWDSDCGGCPDGTPAATMPWVATIDNGSGADWDGHRHNDEHGELFESAMQWADLPPALFQPVDLSVFTTTPGSLRGSALMEAEYVTPHSRLIREFALLPDRGYSLWDWALGFETCPPGVESLEFLCHSFKGYMGVLNSNHFLPQAEDNYVHYHRLALELAEDCKAMADALADAPQSMRTYVLECEKQALIVEAVGQHFLQDAWSAGHMWERWGGPDLGDLPDGSVAAGAVVAAVAGLLHGSESMLDEPDPLSSADPSHQIWYRDTGPDGALHEMVGDLYLPELYNDPTYAEQRDAFLTCSWSGIAEVYMTAGANHSGGAYRSPAVDPTSPQCLGQRATNLSMRMGWDNIDFSRIRILSNVPAITLLNPQLQWDLEMISLRLTAAASDRPLETDMAEGGIESLVGVGVNAAYRRGIGAPPASYSDEESSFEASPRGEGDKDTAVTRVFHRANAVEWCEQLESGDLDALRERALHEEGMGVAKDVCVEFAQRHIEYKKDEEEDEEEGEEDDDLLPTPRICDETDEQPEEEQPEEEQPEEEGEEQEDEEEKYPKSLCHRIARGSAPIIELERLENGPKESAFEMAMRWCSTEPEEDEEEDDGAPPDIGYPTDECEPEDDDDGGGDPPEPNPGDDWGSGFGDPHMRTFDGLAYDMHARGEFVLVRTPNGLFEAQIRTRRADDTPFQCDNVGIIDGMALRLGGNRFTVQHEGGSFVARLDGNVIGPGTRTLADGSVLTVKARRWYVTRPDGTVVFANTTQNWMHVYVSPAAADRGLLRGLLGDGNGEIGDDLRNASGTLVGSMVNGNFEHTSNELYVGFIQTWFVTGPASLFDHGSGEPATYAKLGDKPGLACDYDEMIAARNQCRAHGVPAAWELACALDVKLAGTDMLGAFDDVGPATQTRNRSACVPTPYGDDCAVPCGPPPYPACPAPTPAPTVAPTP